MRKFTEAGVLALLAVAVASVAFGQVKSRFVDGSPMFTTLPPDESVAVAAGTVATWNGSFVTAGTTYNFAMVGTNPAAGSATTIIPTVIIPLIFKFSDGTVLDPTQPACGVTNSPVTSVLNSPIFKSSGFTPGDTFVGNTQYVDAFQRANFWNSVSTVSPNYHVLLQNPPLVNPAVTLTVPSSFGTTAAGSCARIGEVSNAYFKLQLRNLISGIPSTSLPIFLTYNTFFTQLGNCCILGFHTVFGSAPNQLTVSVAAYSDPGIFSVPIEDVHALSHEIGEWMDDPFTNNATPGWTGGQVSKCSKILEVGDPVTGIAFTVNMNGMIYHPEDLVFLPWFAKASAPTQSVNGWYTFLNSFSAPSPTC